MESRKLCICAQVITFSIGGVLPIIAITNNKSLLQAISSTHLVEEKHLRIEISAIKEIVDSENVSVMCVPGVRQFADCLTKKRASPHNLMDVMSSGQLPDLV